MKKANKKIAFVIPCLNEESNILKIYHSLSKEKISFKKKYNFEFIFIDNYSTDNTKKILRELAKKDKSVKVIFNNRNYGPVRSPYYGLLASDANATILIAADFQEPPSLVKDFICHWESDNFKIVLGSKYNSEESIIMKTIRRKYYDFINSISDIPLEKNVTGFGLYDKDVLDQLRIIDDPYPYFRGLICELGYSRKLVFYKQNKRRSGVSKATFYGMFDQSLLAMTKHSKLPIRIMTISGLFFGFGSLLISIIFLILKFIYWDYFALGISPILIGMFFIASIQFFFLGILGEYVGSILTHNRKLPHVIEEERINF
ncbi:glycosyl transferase, family 2 [beta proteobacterium KB13]|uniref:Glycosyl transferase, family 2 n=1 Tax=beta proteobacterium KB13 TaxID=314607 RepID=B6BTI4_9PROT|nr:glycosyl transferase, family 2 [beta proteobacterium KB13]